jgi:hypothetical protein
VHDPVTLDAAGGDVRRLQAFAAHRLDGIPPDLRDPHVASSFRANLFDKINRLI